MIYHTHINDSGRAFRVIKGGGDSVPPVAESSRTGGSPDTPSPSVAQLAFERSLEAANLRTINAAMKAHLEWWKVTAYLALIMMACAWAILALHIAVERGLVG